MDDTGKVTMCESCLLHARADRALRALVAKELEKFNLTMMEWLLLGVVCGGPKEGLSMTAIAKELDVTLPQVTALMTNITKQRLVKQKIQKHDRRSRHVSPTSLGKDLCSQIEVSMKSAMNNWLSEVSPEQMRAYTVVIEMMAERKIEEAPLPLTVNKLVIQ